MPSFRVVGQSEYPLIVATSKIFFVPFGIEHCRIDGREWCPVSGAGMAKVHAFGNCSFLPFSTFLTALILSNLVKVLVYGCDL